MDHEERLFQSEHMRGYVCFGLSQSLPLDASEEFKAGYAAHRWEQVAYLCNRPSEYAGPERRHEH